MGSDDGVGDRLGRFSLLASALAGRALQVAPGEPGEPAWTDGSRVFVDADRSARDQLEGSWLITRYGLSARLDRTDPATTGAPITGELR